jgi:DNA-binding NtrC family response regulator
MRKRSMKQEIESITSEMVAGGIRLDEALREFERHFIRQVLREHNGNQSRAAEALGMHRNTLRNKLSRLG